MQKSQRILGLSFRDSTFQHFVLLVGLFLFWPTSAFACELSFSEIFPGSSSRARDVKKGWVEIKNLSKMPCELDALGFSRFDGVNKTMGFQLNYQNENLVIPGFGKALFVNDSRVGLRQCGDVPIYHLPSPGIRLLKKRSQTVCVHTSNKLFECVNPLEILGEDRECLGQAVEEISDEVSVVRSDEPTHLSSNMWPKPYFRVASTKILDEIIKIDVEKKFGLASWELKFKEASLPSRAGVLNPVILANSDTHSSLLFSSLNIPPATYRTTLCATNPAGEKYCSNIEEIEIVEPVPTEIKMSLASSEIQNGYRALRVVYKMEQKLVGNIQWLVVGLDGSSQLLRTTGNNESFGVVKLFLPINGKKSHIEAKLMTQNKMKALGQISLGN